MSAHQANDGFVLLSLNHVTVRAADFERTEHFYCGLLGMSVGPRPEFKVPGRWLYLVDQPLVHVLSQDANGAAAETQRIDHFAFRATGLAGLEQRLRDAGQVFELKHQPATSEWQLFVVDPDGSQVEIAFPAG